MRRTDQWLLGCFAVTMAVYTAAFAAAFSDLPLNIPPWHQLLLLWWCAAPLLGSALAWLVWAVSLRKSGRGAGKTGRKVL